MSKEQASESIPLRREPVNVGVLLELPTEVLQRQARALRITLTIRIDDDVPDTVYLDRDKVAWIITSLVGSAVRHVRTPGGTIDVHVGFDAAPSTLSISVRDDGSGIPAEKLKRLLKRGGWHPGSALALLLVEDIAIAHGGGIEIESKADPAEHFTTVRVTIPASDSQETN
jgi:signal transduction histidine kinase